MCEDTLLRAWQHGSFRLELHTPRQQRQRADGTTPIAYRFFHDGRLIFDGEDVRVPAGQALDGDATVLGVLRFLALRPGDTDADYFADYTAEQLAWRDEHAEDLANLLAEFDAPAGPMGAEPQPER